MAKRPIISRQEIRDKIEVLNTEPFKDALAMFIGCSPTQSSIREFANKHPDKWANAILNISKLAGYSGASTEINIYTQINNLSDADLQQQLLEVEDKMKIIDSNHKD